MTVGTGTGVCQHRWCWAEFFLGRFYNQSAIATDSHFWTLWSEQSSSPQGKSSGRQNQNLLRAADTLFNCCSIYLFIVTDSFLAIMKEALVLKKRKNYKERENAIFLSTFSPMSVFFPFIADTYNCIVNTYLLLNSLSKIGFFFQV